MKRIATGDTALDSPKQAPDAIQIQAVPGVSLVSKLARSTDQPTRSRPSSPNASCARSERRWTYAEIAPYTANIKFPSSRACIYTAVHDAAALALYVSKL